MTFLVSGVGFAFICKKRILIYTSHLYITINSKCIIDLNVNCETVKFLEEGVRENICDLRLGKEYLDMTPKA